MRKFLSLRKNKKGFTMVELLVVLVIIVILMAAIIPSMLGFIDKAKEEAILAECRNVQLAAETQLNELYGTSPTGAVTTGSMTAVKDKVLEIAGVGGEYAETPGDLADGAIVIETPTSGTARKPFIKSISYTATNGEDYQYTKGKGWEAP